MNRYLRSFSIVCLFFLICLPLAASAASETRFDFIIDVKPSVVSPGESFAVSVKCRIPKDHYLFADDLLIEPESVPGVAFEDVQRPPGQRKDDPYLGVIHIYSEDAEFSITGNAAPSASAGNRTIIVNLKFRGCAKGVCFLPEEKKLSVSLVVNGSGIGSAAAVDPFEPISIPDNGAPVFDQESVPVFDDETGLESEETAPVFFDPAETQAAGKNDAAPAPSSGDARPDKENKFSGLAERFGIIGVLAAAFLWGVLASLTPCVYPMIPITIGVIGARSEGSIRKGFILSLVYVLGLSLTYAMFGLIASLSGGLFGEQANHPAVRIIVGVVFVALGLSMFDLFQLQLPSSLQTRLGKYSGSGMIGVFLTGAVGGCIVGPCVGPLLVGLLVYVATLGSKLYGFLIMWTFALGLGMLFLLIGTFSGMASALPKAGTWMETVKRFFGIVFFGIAVYYAGPLLDIQTSLLLTGAVLIALGLFFYTLGKGDEEYPGIRLLWKTAAVVLLTIGICYVGRFAVEDRTRLFSRSGDVSDPGISWLYNESSALETAKNLEKPVMIDFRADWCTDCKKLEAETFPSPAVTRESRRFVNVKIDLTNASSPESARLKKKYDIKGLPTILFLDRSGKLIPDTAVTGFLKPEEMAEHMRRIE